MGGPAFSRRIAPHVMPFLLSFFLYLRGGCPIDTCLLFNLLFPGCLLFYAIYRMKCAEAFRGGYVKPAETGMIDHGVCISRGGGRERQKEKRGKKMSSKSGRY